MSRTIISLPADDKDWLASYGRRHRISSAEVIRRAISEFRRKEPPKKLATVIRETAGTWTSLKGESREYVESLRKDWERSR